MSGKVAIICDFDGTIAVRDVGHCFFERFIPDRDAHEDILEKWKLGLISSKECLEQELAWTDATVEQLDEFIEKEKFDPYFKDFVDFCNRRKYEFVILSDGLDYYIENLLMKNGLGYLDFRANHLVLGPGGILDKVEFPFYGLKDGCTMCANCKAHHVVELREKGFYTVYIGNGYSDRCPSEHADLVFAKADLLEHVRRNGIKHSVFKNFRDVERGITEKLLINESD